MRLRVGDRHGRGGGTSPAEAGGKGGWRQAVRDRRHADRGQLAVEFAGMVPTILVTMAVLWQCALTGYAFVLSGNVADKAVRAGATADTWRESRDQACERGGREDLPGGWTARIDCRADGDMVTADVEVRVPVLFPGGVDFDLGIDSRSSAVKES
ncbi:TadE/TadG family type IV pilus assembly protein [Streptomyces sp. CC228A]|uniref:TadE/TadG family type IV pilus assembly protein n=1 Tax=Streptomyces sp. CC228A TaxID=2898186 RepID=UPI001F204830|nr:pilus assembly protein [Streptomyces sp. CC228A]